ncbi:MAG: bifunctional ADP-dependent NAD(P)H-hydrate dehydratase/NAD(P)H-hydrate epimerase [Desulfobacteraceae bacterium 4572_130]|nr:MAG: bifunctional ADP-dependent NAD(P)H-hydrate dehydratase/NAD(P)H-hydrate epimerase [Desulfobacteraceae bacterium 4572_130]
MYLVTAKEMQKIDNKTIKSFGMAGEILMENAGRGAFDMLVDLFPEIALKKVCILAGRGNNGGDGFVIARYLIEKKVKTGIFILCERGKIKGDAKTNLTLLEKLCEKTKLGYIKEIPDKDTFLKYKNKILHYNIFVDAILGTGLNSDVRGFFRDVIETCNSSSNPIFSIDIPSGLNANTGKPLGVCIKANSTATFAFAKIGHILYPGNEFTGKLKIINIGIPGFIVKNTPPLVHLLDKKMIKLLFVPRNSQSHKGDFGHLFVIAGSIGKTGAAALTCNAAMACGAGLVTLGIPKSLNSTLEPQVIETMTLPLPEEKKGYLSDIAFNKIQKFIIKKNVLALGPGLGTEKSTKKLVQKLIENIEIPIIIDADALNLIAGKPEILKKRKAPVILTPHPGEMARLSNKSIKQIQENRTESAREFAAKFNVIVVLKGAQTIIALPDNKIFICTWGNSGMASGGMGDVLTGIIASLIAQNFSCLNAAIAGVYIHGMCGDILAKTIGSFGFLASDMINTIPRAINNILK